MAQLLDRLRGGSCGRCGTRPVGRVAERVVGQSGDVEVEFTGLPYSGCECGHVARWLFDPGAELSTQLFFEGGIPIARRGDRCVSCSSALQTRRALDLATEARIDEFAPIGFRAHMTGFVCDGCGLGQAPFGSFDVDGSDGFRAVIDAVRQLGLGV